MAYWIDDPNGAANPPAPPPDTELQTWFQEEDAANGIPKVYIRAWWLNMLLQEILAVVVWAGITPAKAVTNQLLAALQKMFAPLISPGFSGTPTTPTATAGNNSTIIASTAFVDTAVAAEASRAANVEGNLQTYKAPLYSPGFSGVPTVPSPAVNDSSGQIPNTNWISSYFLNRSGGIITGQITIANDASLFVTGQVNATGAVCQNGTWSGNTSSGYNPIFSQLTGVFLSQGIYAFNGSNAAAYFGSGAAGGHIVEFYGSHGGVIGSIANSSDTGVTYNSTSDERLKQDVETLDGVEALKTIERLRPISFFWRARPEIGPRIGFLAHEFGDVLPYALTGARGATRTLTRAVRGDDQDQQPKLVTEEQILPQMIDDTRTVPYLVAAVAHLASELRDVRARLAVTEGQAAT